MQKYVHDLTTWDALPVEAQERVIGREKLSDVELPDDVKPANSHVALTTIVDDAANSSRSCASTCRSAGWASASSVPTSSATHVAPT